MKITLIVPCFVDLMYPQAGMAIVHIVEKFGHEVECPKVLCAAVSSGQFAKRLPGSELFIL